MQLNTKQLVIKSKNIERYPRVLIVSAEPIHRGTGTGITISNLFDAWPQEKLAQLYLNNHKPDMKFCGHSYKLHPRYFPLDYQVRKTMNYFKVNPQKNKNYSKVSNERAVIRPIIHEMARVINDLSPFRVPNELQSWLNKYDPQVIYTPLGSIRIIKLVLSVVQICKKPVIPHFMDDWLSTLYANILVRYPREILYKKLMHVFSYTPCGLCISEEMADEYINRFAFPFQAFMNCVDNECFMKPDMRKSDPFVITYIGGLHLQRWEPLYEIACVARELGAMMRIIAPSDDLQRYSNKFKNIKDIFLGTVHPDEVSVQLRHADIAVHVESFNSMRAKYTRFSVSTKIPQYMAAGKPIIALGPENLASMRLIGKAKAGIVVGSFDKQKLKSALSQLISDHQYRLTLAINGWNYAKQYFFKKTIQEKFFQFICRIALNSNDIGRSNLDSYYSFHRRECKAK